MLKLVNNKRTHTSGDIIEEMKVVYEIDINYMKVWRVKKRAIVLKHIYSIYFYINIYLF